LSPTRWIAVGRGSIVVTVVPVIVAAMPLLQLMSQRLLLQLALSDNE